MQNQLTSFLKGVDQAACAWFGQYGGALETLGFGLVLGGNPLSTTVGSGLMLANAAAEAGCNYDPNNTAGGTPVPGIDGCAETDGAAALVCYYGDGQIAGIPLTVEAGCNEIIAVTEGTNNDGSPNLKIDTGYLNGSRGYVLFPNYDPNRGGYVSLEPEGDVSCVRDEDTTKPELSPEDLPTINYTDPETNCSMNISFKGYAEGPSGQVYQIQQIEAANDPANSTRAGGGIIGGCNFNPTIVVKKIGGGGGDEPPITIPVPSPTPPSGDDWWKPYVQAAIQGVVAGAVEELIENLLNRPYSEVIYRAVSVCEKDADGEDISEAVEIPIPQLKAPDAQLARLDAIAELLQAHKNFKQPICGKTKPVLKGQWVTTRWKSDEVMDHSGKRLRKLFRYRTQSTRDVGQLSAYWCDFVWRSGNVCTFHKGAWWGTPQVWAESEEEGKRVIRFAASEAGLDPDQVGEWGISGSSTPRYGMSGTMKIQVFEGYPWVAKRDGSDWPNYLAKPSNP